MVKLVDTPDLGSGAARHGGSSPLFRTTSITAYFSIILINQINHIRKIITSISHCFDLQTILAKEAKLQKVKIFLIIPKSMLCKLYFKL